MKVIHICPRSLSHYQQTTWQRFLLTEGWHLRLGEQMLKRPVKYQMEYWRPEMRLNRVVSGEKNGLRYEIFPSHRLGFKQKLEYSRPLLKALQQQVEKEDTLIHIHGIHQVLSYLVARSLKGVPIVGSPLGDAPKRYLLTSGSGLRKVYALLPYLLEPGALKEIDVIFTGTRDSYNSLSKLHPNVKLFHSVGVDFEKFKPLARSEARGLLNLPPEKKIMLFVGKLDPHKDVPIILDAYRELKARYDVQLVLVGGERGDSLFKNAVESGATVIEHIPTEELIPYYSAADVYLLPRFDKDITPFSGFGIAPIECLACGTPIVGTNLRHFMGDENELKAIGKIPESPEDVVNCVSEVFDDPAPYTRCRDIARKYYDWDVIVGRILNIYEELEQRYYGKT